MLFYGTHSSFYFKHGRHMEEVTIIESYAGMRQCDPLGGLLFILAHYQIFLETIMWAPICIFPSLADDIHIVGPMNEIICALSFIFAIALFWKSMFLKLGGGHTCFSHA